MQRKQAEINTPVLSADAEKFQKSKSVSLEITQKNEKPMLTPSKKLKSVSFSQNVAFFPRPIVPSQSSNPNTTKEEKKPIETIDIPIEEPKVVETIQTVDPSKIPDVIETIKIVNSIETIQTVNPIETIQSVNPIETTETTQIFNPIETTQIFNPIETTQIFNPIETTQIVNPIETIETTQTVNPIETTQTVNPIFINLFLQSVPSRIRT